MTRIMIDPVVVPPKPQKVFDVLWSTAMTTLTPNPGDPGRCVITWKPMSVNETSVELYDQEERIETDELMLAREEVPEVKTAFAAFIAAIIPLRNWVRQREALKNTPPQQEALE